MTYTKTLKLEVNKEDYIVTKSKKFLHCWECPFGSPKAKEILSANNTECYNEFPNIFGDICSNVKLKKIRSTT